MLRKAENTARRNNENQKKQGKDGGRQGRGGGFAANTCLPVNSVRLTMPGICLPSDLSMANTTLLAAQLRATPWYIDSCSSFTLCHNIEEFENLDYSSQRSFKTANGAWISTTAKGTVHITLMGADNVSTFLTINNAYYCPEVSANLISLGQLARNDCTTLQIGLDMTVYDPAFSPILYSRCEDDVFVVNNPRFVAAATSRGASLLTWHKRLGHANYKYVEKIGDCINIVAKDRPFCEPCTKGNNIASIQNSQLTIGQMCLASAGM